MCQKVRNHIYIYILVATLINLTVFSALILSSAKTFASDSAVDTINLTIPESCNLSTSSGSGQTYNVQISNGQYKNDIGKTRLTVFCNTQDSFAVYAVGYSNDTVGSTDMVTTTSGATNILTGTATSGNTSNWAMKIEAVAGNGTDIYTPTIQNPFNDFTSVPSSYAKVAEVTSVTTRTVEGAIDATYQVYISPNQQAGAYTGKVRYTVVHPATDIPLGPVVPEPGKISYVPNAPGILDTMGDQEHTGYTTTVSDFTTPLSDNSEATLWASNFQRPGYGFAGWNTEYDYSGTTYGPNETITTPSDLTTNGLTLYAVWVKSAGNLQNWTGCNSMNIGDVTALTDLRDNDTYAVAKLADGKCWMIENLRLGGTTQMVLTPVDTNITANITLPASTSTFSGNDTTIQVNAANTLIPISNMTTPTDAQIYSYGNYYSWAAAIGTTTSYSSVNVSTSICPKGWHLPTGKVNNEYSALGIAIGGTGDSEYNNAVNSNRWRTYPNNFLYSGQTTITGTTKHGHAGGVWSSTSESSGYALYLLLRPLSVNPGNANSPGKYVGNNIRCLAD